MPVHVTPLTRARLAAALTAGAAILSLGLALPASAGAAPADPPDEPDDPYAYCYPEYPIFTIGGMFLGCVKDM